MLRNDLPSVLEQRFDLAAQGVIAFARVVKKRRTFAGREGERLVIQPFDVRPAISRHHAQMKGHGNSGPRRSCCPMPTPVPGAPSAV